MERFISLMTQSFLNNIIIDWPIGCQKRKSILLELFAWPWILVLTQHRQADVINYLKNNFSCECGVIGAVSGLFCVFPSFHSCVCLINPFAELQRLYSVVLLRLELMFISEKAFVVSSVAKY